MTVVSLLTDYAPSLVAFSLFALLHSVGAREPFKHALTRWTSPFFVEHFWRLVYCVLSLAALYYGVATLHWTRHPDNDVWLIVYPDWLWQAIIVVHLGSVALLYIAFIQSDYLEFLGLKQAWRCRRRALWSAHGLDEQRPVRYAPIGREGGLCGGFATQCWWADSSSC